MQNYALTSPKPQTYIEKAPICSKTDFGPAEAVGRSQTRPVEDFLSSPKQCPNIT